MILIIDEIVFVTNKLWRVWWPLAILLAAWFWFSSKKIFCMMKRHIHHVWQNHWSSWSSNIRIISKMLNGKSSNSPKWTPPHPSTHPVRHCPRYRFHASQAVTLAIHLSCSGFTNQFLHSIRILVYVFSIENHLSFTENVGKTTGNLYWYYVYHWSH